MDLLLLLLVVSAPHMLPLSFFNTGNRKRNVLQAHTPIRPKRTCRPKPTLRGNPSYLYIRWIDMSASEWNRRHRFLWRIFYHLHYKNIYNVIVSLFRLSVFVLRLHPTKDSLWSMGTFWKALICPTEWRLLHNLSFPFALFKSALNSSFSFKSTSCH